MAEGLAETGMDIGALAPPHFAEWLAKEKAIPQARFAEPEEIAATALFLASDLSRFYCGQVLGPNGGGKTSLLRTSAGLERLNSLVCRCASSSATLRLTVASGAFLRRAAADRLPASATASTSAGGGLSSTWRCSATSCASAAF